MLLRRSSRNSRNAAPLIREARETLEWLKETELQDYFRDRCIADFKARQRGVEKTVAPDTAVIYPVILPDKLELLVSVGEEDPWQTSIPITKLHLEETVKKFRRLLERRATNEFLDPARWLYDLLIRPIDAVLAGRGVGTLVVVPDGVLRTVPFAALHDGERFLVERYALATAPGLRLVEPRPLTPKARRTLAAGLSLGHDGHPALPNVAFELEGIRRLQRGTTLLDSAFQRSRFERELRDGNYNIVHIASHSQVGRDPSQIFVLAYDGQLTLDELEASIQADALPQTGHRAASAERLPNGGRGRRPRGTRSGRACPEGGCPQRAGDALVRQRRSLHGADNRVLPTAAEQNPGTRAAEHAAQPDERSGAPPPVLLGPISAHRQLALAKEPAVMKTRRAFSMSAIGVAAGGLLVQTGLAQPAGQLQGTDGLQNRSTPRGRIGAIIRSDHEALAPELVAPLRGVGLTMTDQPSLYYLLSGRVTHPVRLAIAPPANRGPSRISNFRALSRQA